jgi:dsDNA-binding SOS-regulon protein
MAGGSLVDCLGPGIPGPSFPVGPIPGECPIRSEEINKAIYSDMDKAMSISTAIEKVLDKAGIQFSEDETFAVTFHAAKRPEYVSEVVSAEAQPGVTGSAPRTTFMMAPDIMKQVMRAVERDRIK